MSPRLVLLVAVLATTYSGPIVRFAAAPALVIAFWRLALVVPVTGAVAAAREGGARRGRFHPETGAAAGRPSPAALMLCSGLLLGAHFWTWLASLRFTTVASSVLLVNLRPIFVWVIAALWLAEHPGPRERWGIVLAVAGAALIGLGDAGGPRGALAGDALALLGALAMAGYSVIGRRVRRSVGVWSYVTVVYTAAAVALAVVALASRTPLTGYTRRDWAVFVALAAGPMLVGHTGFNYALKYFRATTVNVASLGEPVGAALIAWLVPAIHEVPGVTLLVGGTMVLVGIGLSLGDGKADGGGPVRSPHVG